MDKETVKRLADECGIVKSIISPAYMLATNAQLLAFAQACCDWQLEKDAQICDELAQEWDSDAVIANKNYAASGSDAIRNAKESPESDIEEARRR
jgi:hypothetical protein